MNSVLIFCLLLFLISIIFFVIDRFRIKKITRQDEILKKELEQQTTALHDINTKLKSAKKETDVILQNVEEGFFLLNPEYKVKTQYTSSLERMLRTEQLAGKLLTDLLQTLVSEETIENSKDFLDLMFNIELDENMLNELNPLDLVEVKTDELLESALPSQFLAFHFRRILDSDSNIYELFITVIDLTDQINLTKKLEKSATEQKRKMQLMFGILHVEPELFSEFLTTLENETQYIRKHLNQPPNEAHIQAIYRSVHSVKGNASLLDLQTVVVKTHSFEDYLMKVLKSKKFSKQILPEIMNQFQELETIFLELKDMLSIIKNFQTNFRPKRRYENKILIESLEKLVETTAKGLSKSVRLNHEKFDPGSIPYNLRLLVKEILIQLVRNAISHGIEPPKVRVENGKAEEGVLSLSSVLKPDSFQLRLHDDGQGIKVEKLKQKILDSGKWSQNEVNDWSETELLYKIFEPGISTHDGSDYISGRGIGMDIINYKLKKSNGNIHIDHDPGFYCEFEITLPLSKN